MSMDIETRIEEKFRVDNFNSFPQKNLLIEVTNVCNNKCVFCANRKMTRAKGQIDFDLAKRVLKECYDLGTREVGFYATGEPLLYKELYLLIREAKNLGYTYVYLTTNGLLAKRDIIEPLLKEGLDSIKFSINAINAEDYNFIHGVNCFDIVLENLRSCKCLQEEYHNKLFVSCILTKYTNYSRDEVENFFRGMCDKVVVQNVKNQGGLLPNINKHLLIEKDNVITNSFGIPCSYVFNSVTVSYEGYLTACCMDFQNYLAYADLNKVSVKDGWQNLIITEFRNKQKNGDVGCSICKACVFGDCDNIKPLDNKLTTIVDKDFFDIDNDMINRIRNKNKKGE